MKKKFNTTKKPNLARLITVSAFTPFNSIASMNRFHRLNNLIGWLVFAVAASVYLLTIEPTASFWDCSERIVASYKLEIPHPPGAPFFMLLGNFFTKFAGGNIQRVAVMVNIMSALAAAFTILFLFWSITHLSRKLLLKQGGEPTLGQTVAILGAGAIGALAYTFTDSFWFIAVEAEAYATSSMFTAFVFWAILKWENVANEPHSNRWLILIAYIMGLSIGVHLLNLLTIPAIVFVYYFKKYEVSTWGVVAALGVAVAMLGAVMYVFIPGIVTLISGFELLFINGFGFPYNSGAIFFIVVLFALFSYGIWNSYRKRRVLLNTILLGGAVITIGFLSYTLLIVRAQANTPMNQNNPSTVFTLLSYLNREQYGDRPLVIGQYYNAPVIGSKELTTYIKKDGKYEKSYLKTQYQFDERFQSFFPRMWSWRDDHVEEYKKWGNIKGYPVRITTGSGDYEVRYVPTFGENLRFFFTYQLGHMYWRYFMWNFVGRQNDIQGHGDLLNGNWITGIKSIDAIRLGNQDKLTSAMLNDPSRNTYYFLPLLLGIAGMAIQFSRDQKNFWVIALLFILTGMAIVVYLNQYPLQPRERDYSYVGSFYAFSIWVGLGVLGLYEVLKKGFKSGLMASFLAILIALPIPALLATENWDDHDRSGRYITRDFAYNYLNTCEPNAIIFTNGDNDTFPLWYAQEVEGIRTDVRIVNLSLLGTDWYCEQMKWKSNDSDPLPITMNFDQFVQGTRDIVYFVDKINKPIELKQLMDFIGSNRPETRIKVPSGEFIDYYPSNQVKMTIDKEAVLRTGTVSPEDAHLIVDAMEWTINKESIQKPEMMMLEIIANNNWERPIYFVSTGGDSDIGISDYLQFEGFAYRLVPIKTKASDFLSISRFNIDKLYQNYMEKFKWGRMNEPGVLIDHNIQRTAMVLRLRNNFGRLADELLDAGKRDSAVKVLDRISELLPQSKFPFDFFVIGHIETYYNANETEKANDLINRYASSTVENLEYYFSLEKNYAKLISYEKELNLQILQELVSTAKKYGQSTLSDELEPILNNFIMLYYRG